MWLEVELLAAEGLARIGVVPLADVIELRERAPVVDADFVRAVAAREETTNHDVAAFVDVVQERIGQPVGRGSTTGSPRRTWSTPRRAPRS